MQPILMGIVNITPDSFSDGGLFLDPEKAVKQALKCYESGAKIIDLGAESTRPGAELVSTQIELDRILPVLTQLIQIRKDRNLEFEISIDTSKPIVMESVLSAGADWINDVNAFQALGALEVLQKYKNACRICVMHAQGEPKTMQKSPHYSEESGGVLQAVIRFLESRLAAFAKIKFPSQNIILDPGFGFGKNLYHNFFLLSNLNKLTEYFKNYDFLIGVSRKSMFSKLLNISQDHFEERVAPSILSAIMAYFQRVQFMRVHDVWETQQAFKAVLG